jgi:hypothetical protein
MSTLNGSSSNTGSVPSVEPYCHPRFEEWAECEELATPDLLKESEKLFVFDGGAATDELDEQRLALLMAITLKTNESPNGLQPAGLAPTSFSMPELRRATPSPSHTPHVEGTSTHLVGNNGKAKKAGWSAQLTWHARRSSIAMLFGDEFILLHDQGRRSNATWACVASHLWSTSNRATKNALVQRTPPTALKRDEWQGIMQFPQGASFPLGPIPLAFIHSLHMGLSVSVMDRLMSPCPSNGTDVCPPVQALRELVTEPNASIKRIEAARQTGMVLANEPIHTADAIAWCEEQAKRFSSLIEDKRRSRSHGAHVNPSLCPVGWGKGANMELMLTSQRSNSESSSFMPVKEYQGLPSYVGMPVRLALEDDHGHMEGDLNATIQIRDNPNDVSSFTTKQVWVDLDRPLSLCTLVSLPNTGGETVLRIEHDVTSTAVVT